MWLIVGLGNPGQEYAFTRHNIGFMVVDAWEPELRIVSKVNASYGIVKKCLYGVTEIAILKPFTYMNRSGIAVKEAIRLLGIGTKERLVVIHDDLDLPLGRIKIVKRGSSGGHRGVDSIIYHINTNEFTRVRVGIDRPKRDESVYEYVLSVPYEEERRKFQEIIERGVEALKMIVERGTCEAMNYFNRKKV